MRSLAGFTLPLLVVSLAAAPVAADDVTPDPNDPGRVTRVRKGASEIDLGGIFVLSVNKVEDESTTQISSLMGAGYQFYINDNLSIGGTALFNYDKTGPESATGFGGVLYGTFHVRLGLGAFLRPTLGLGALFGTRELDSGMGGVVLETKQTAFLTRIGFPIAYFASKRVVLQAGPELNISIGNFTPEGGESTSYTTIAGGFGVGVGYMF